MGDHKHPAATLTCRELVELVTDYLEGALAPPDRKRFEAHLDACGGCGDYLDQIRRTISALGRPDYHALTADERAGLRRLFQQALGPADEGGAQRPG